VRDVRVRAGRPRDPACDAAILQATLDIFAEHGYGGVSMDGVAARAGVGKATIYRRYRSKDELMLEALSVLGSRFVATESTNTRSLSAGELAARAEPYFEHVENVVDPAEARRRALALAGPDGAVLVTGSLYLLTELSGTG